MTTYVVGNTLASRVEVRDAAGALANTGVTPTCSVTLPDGTSTSATVATAATGIYQATLTSTQAGRHRFTWSASGANSGDFPIVDPVDVWPLDPRLIVPLADAKAALNIPSSITTNDDEITLYIAAATDYIENITGPLLSVTGKTWTADGGRQAVMLPEEAASITSVTVDGTATTDYTADLRAGIVYKGTGTGAGTLSFTSGKANVVVTYTVGGSTVPPAAVLAARELIRYWWQTSQQGGRPAFGGDTASPLEPYFPARQVEVILAPIADAMPGLA